MHAQPLCLERGICCEIQGHHISTFQKHINTRQVKDFSLYVHRFIHCFCRMKESQRFYLQSSLFQTKKEHISSLTQLKILSSSLRLTKTFVNLLFTVLSRTSTCGYEFKVIFMLETLNSHLKKRFWVATIVTCISVFILFLFLNYNLLKHELKNRKQRAHLLVEILKDKIMIAK